MTTTISDFTYLPFSSYETTANIDDLRIFTADKYEYGTEEITASFIAIVAPPTNNSSWKVIIRVMDSNNYELAKNTENYSINRFTFTINTDTLTVGNYDVQLYLSVKDVVGSEGLTTGGTGILNYISAPIVGQTYNFTGSGGLTTSGDGILKFDNSYWLIAKPGSTNGDCSDIEREELVCRGALVPNITRCRYDTILDFRCDQSN